MSRWIREQIPQTPRGPTALSLPPVVQETATQRSSERDLRQMAPFRLSAPLPARAPHVEQPISQGLHTELLARHHKRRLADWWPPLALQAVGALAN